MLLLALLLAASPEFSYQTAHAHSPEALALSPDGHLLAAASTAEYQVRLWDLGTSQLLRVIPTDQQQLLGFSVDGKVLGIYNQGTLQLYDVRTGAQLPARPPQVPYEHTYQPAALAFAQGRILMAEKSFPGTLFSWDLAGNAREWSRLPVEPFTDLDVAPGGQRGLLISQGALALFDAAAVPGPKLLTQVPSPLSGPQDWAFTAGGKYVLGASNDALVFLDPATLELVKKLPAPAGKRGSTPPQVPRMQLGTVAVAVVGKQVIRVDAATLAIVSVAPGWEKDTAIYRQDGNIMIGVHGNTFANDDGMFTTLDAATGEKLAGYGGVAGDAPDVRFDWQGRLVWVSAGGTNGTDLAKGQLTRILDVGSARELVSEPIVFGDLSPDGRTLVSTDRKLGIQLRSLETGARQQVDLSKLHGDKWARADGTWSPSGRFFAFEARGNAGAGIVLWDVRRAAVAAYFHDEGGIGESQTVFSADDALAAVSFRPGNKFGSEDWSFRVVELATGKVLLERKGLVRAFTRDGTGVATSNEFRELTGDILDARGGKPQEPLLKPGEALGSLVIASRLQVEAWSQLHEFLANRTAVNRTPDGTIVAEGSPAGELTLFDASTGAVRSTLHGHEGQIRAIRFSPDSKRMLTYGADRLTSLWNVATGEKVATFAVTGWTQYSAKELAIYTPDGFYYGQRAAVRQIAVRSGTRAWPLAQFDAWLNRPDLVLERLGSAPPATIDYYRLAHERRLRKLGLSGTAPPLELPEVTIHREGLTRSTPREKVALHLDTAEHGAPIVGLQVYANGVPLFGPQGTPPPQGSLEVELAAGPNKIEVTAIDALGRESVADMLRVERSVAKKKPELYALAVGVSQYAQAEYALQYAAKDAQHLLAALRAPDGERIYSKVHTLAIVDGEATRESIAAKAREFLAPAQIDDRVVLFFAGHGLLDARAGYFFATADLDFDHPEARGLSFDQMEALLAGLRARHRLMLVDTCAAGETDEDEVARKSGTLPAGVKVASRGVKRRASSKADAPGDQLLLTRELFGSLRRGSGASVIGSSSGVEYAFESAALKNGVFTAALLETLRGVDVNPTLSWADSMEVDALEATVRDKVLAKSGGQQHPVARETNPEDQFTVWRAGWDKDAENARKAARRKKR